MLLFVKGIHSYFIHSRSMQKFVRRRVQTNGTSRPPYNATVNCLARYINSMVMCFRCGDRLFFLTVLGYPWRGFHKYLTKKQNRNNTLKDPLDFLNHVCDTAGRAQTCLQDRCICDYCFVSYTDRTVSGSSLIPSFSFICQPQYRNENLLHSLRCLHDNRLISMLYFRIGSQCGIGILDRIMKGNHNVFWYGLNVSPPSAALFAFPLLCVPNDVISTCVRVIVENQCGNMTAVLVQDYLLYIQAWAEQALLYVGLDPDICHHDVDITTSDTYMPPQYDISGSSPNTQLLKLAERGAPGSAMESIFAQGFVRTVKKWKDGNFCITKVLRASVQICLLLSEDTSARSKFNILQFSHQIRPKFAYHGSSCTRLPLFTECWKLLQETCGPRVRGFALQATLLIEGCEIQTLMDSIGCPWQDMLIWHYMEASRKTAWPFVFQGLYAPLHLDNQPDNVKNVLNDMGKVIALLQPGVDEIKDKCGSEPAAHLWRLLNKIRYLQKDAFCFFSRPG